MIKNIDALLALLDDDAAYKLLRENKITTIQAAEVLLDGYACQARAIAILQMRREASGHKKTKKNIVVPGTEYTIQEAVEYLEYCSREYYNRGESPISDAEYDSLFCATRRLAPDNDFFTKKVRARVEAEKKLKLQNEVRSLDKIEVKQDKATGAFDQESTFAALVAWLDKTLGANEQVFISPKYDGLTCVIYYDQGTMVAAATGGDGIEGKDITQQIAVVTGIPSKLPIQITCEVQGELVLRKSHLEFLRKHDDSVSKTANARNLAAGTISLHDIDKIRARGLDFCAWNILMNGEPYSACEDEKFLLLKQLGFSEIGELGLVSKNELAKIQSYYLSLNSLRNTKFDDHDLRLIEDVSMDGIVITVNDKNTQRNLGVATNYPKYSIAIKFPMEIAETTVRDIVWNVSRNGRIVPTLILDPVYLEGTTVTRATGDNFKKITNEEIGIGARVHIGKAGLTIPKVLGVVGHTSVLHINTPTICPSCQAGIYKVGVDLVCRNFACPEQITERLIHFFCTAVSDKVGVSESFIRSLYDGGLVKTVADFYSLTLDALIKIPGIGDSKAKSFLRAIEDSKYMPLNTLLRALSIPGLGDIWAIKLAELLGEKGAQLLNPAVLTYEMAFELLNGCNTTINTNVLTNFATWFSIPDNQQLIQSMQKNGVKVLLAEQIHEPSNGVHVCITGQTSLPRKEFSALLKKNGYEVDDVVKRTTNILVCNVASNSSKTQKAQKRGIRIITEVEMLAEMEKLLPNRIQGNDTQSEQIKDEHLWNRAISITKKTESEIRSKPQTSSDKPNEAPVPINSFEELDIFDE